MENLKHTSVLLNESINLLAIKKNGRYVDCTLGGGGHSSLILEKIPEGHLYCFDQDQLAIDLARDRLSKISDNFTIIKDNFKNIKQYLDPNSVDGIIYDLGVSSFQFDIPERGFSYRFDGPLDMRMNQEDILTACDVVNNYSESQLRHIFYQYGEEKYASNIAKRIINERGKKSILTTLELVELIKKAKPASELRKPGHPAKQVFQALRIEVNHELEILKKALDDGLSCLSKHGRMVVITFHSLEDRIVKNLFKEKTTLDLPKDLPFIPDGYHIDYALLNNKIILPSAEELAVNKRSHSAKMRGIEKIQ